VRSGVADDRFDRQPGAMLTASVAPSSRRVTANSEALNRGQLLAYAAELIDPPPTPAPVVLGEAPGTAAA
jgi:hypothetical protein